MSHQEMPPNGGFGSINIERTFAKRYASAGKTLIIGLAATIYGAHLARNYMLDHRALKAENVEHYIAVEPFLIAERERNFLNHLYDIREEERRLMADVPGWKVGTLYGERLFKTLPKDSLPPVNTMEFFAHVHPEKKALMMVPDNFI